MPEARLYLLSESEFDDAFLRVIVSRITRWEVPCDETRHACHHYSFTGVNDDNEGEILAFFQTLRAKARTLGGDSDVFLIVVRDNDRGPFSPAPADPETTYPLPLAKLNRLRQLERCRDIIITADDDEPVYPCAVGISVQMIESWIILANDTDLTESTLPLFASKYQTTVKGHFAAQGQSTVPKQLKDLYDEISSNARRRMRRDFNRQVAEKADLDSLATRSPSFAAFVSELRRLPTPPA